MYLKYLFELCIFLVIMVAVNRLIVCLFVCVRVRLYCIALALFEVIKLAGSLN